MARFPQTLVVTCRCRVAGLDHDVAAAADGDRDVVDLRRQMAHLESLYSRLAHTSTAGSRHSVTSLSSATTRTGHRPHTRHTRHRQHDLK